MSACCGRIRAARSGCRRTIPLAPPRIDPRFLSDERDAELMLKGVKIDARHRARRRRWRNTAHKEIYTAGVASDAELMAHIRARADTIYHPVGTCKMGVDDDGGGRSATAGARA